MDRNSIEVNWSDEQWSRVLKTVADEATRARVAASFLPLYGPVDAGTLGVPNLKLSYQCDPHFSSSSDRQRLCVDSEPNTMLATIAVQVSLHSHEVHDPELNAAIGMFRRAANVIARVEDALIFHGQADRGQPPAAGIANLPPIFSVTGGRPQPGLLTALTRVPAAGSVQTASIDGPFAGSNRGDAVVSGIVQAINQLESNGHIGPFACVMGHELFAAVCTPSAGLILPRDRILPFLDGPLLRSSTVPAEQGLVIGLGGNPVELVVGADISVRFLQMTPEPRFLFRVSERVALRAREWSAVVVLDPKVSRVQAPNESWEAPPPPARLQKLTAA